MKLFFTIATFVLFILPQNTIGQKADNNPEKLLLEAEKLYVKGEYDSTLLILNRADAICRTENSYVNKHVDILNLQCKTYIRLSKYKEATRSGQRCINVLNNAETDSLEYKALIYNNVATAYLSLKERDSSAYLLDKALDIYVNRLKKEDLTLANIYDNMGTLSRHKSQYNTAKRYYTKSLNIYNKLNSKHYISISGLYSNMGMVESLLKNYDESLKYYNTAIDILRKQKGIKEFRFNYLYNAVSRLYEIKGDYPKALEYVNMALKLSLDKYGENSSWVASSYNSMASIYSQISDFDKAREYFNKCLVIRKKVYGANHYLVAFIYNGLASNEYNSGKKEKAIEYYKLAFEIMKKRFGAKHPYLSIIAGNISTAYKGAKNYNASEEWLNIKSNSLTEKQRSRDAQLLMLYSDLYKEKGEYDKALEYINRAVTVKKTIDPYYHNQEVMYLKRKAEIMFAKGEFVDARRLYRESINLYKKNIDKSISVNSNSEKNLEMISDLYKRSFVCNNKIGDDTEMLRDLELARANYLFQRLQKNYILDKYDNDMLSVDIKRKQLELTGLQDSIIVYKKLKHGVKLSDCILKINDITGEIDSLYKALLDKYPDYKSQTDYSDVIQQLKPEEVLKDSDKLAIYYMIYENTLWISMLSDKGLTVKKVENIESLKDDIHNYHKILSVGNGFTPLYKLDKNGGYKLYTDDELRKVLGNRGFVKFIISKRKPLVKRQILAVRDSLAVKIYNKLFASVRDDIKEYRDLLIIPDDYTSKVPFSTLFEFKGNKRRYLLDDHNIMQANSLSIYLRNSGKLSKRGRRSGKFMGVAVNRYSRDVVAHSSDVESVVNRTVYDYKFSDRQIVSLLSKKRKGYSNYPFEFSNLDYSVDEVSRISTFFNNDKNKGILLYNDLATEAAIFDMNEQDKLKDIKTLHFATHGYYSNKNPQRSAIVLYDYNKRGDIEGNSIDGFLTIPEIMRLRLNADLVVLSACETGVVKEMAAEAVYGLTYAFNVAGAKNVISSLWRVDDYSSSVFFIELYSRMKRGEDVYIAINNVYRLFINASRDTKTKIKPYSKEMKEMLKLNKFYDPYSWSGFVMR